MNNNRTLARRDSFSAWMSGFESYLDGVYGETAQSSSPNWQEGYYAAQAAEQLAEYKDDIADRMFHARGEW